MGLVLAIAVAIPASWMPTVIGVTFTDSGVEVTYNESAASAILDPGPYSSDTDAGPDVAGSEGDNGSSSTTPRQSESSQADDAEALIHARINRIRSEEGLPELSRSEQLDEVAQYHSDDMAEKGYFSHTSPEGETLQSRYQQHGIGCAGGENIFRTQSTYGTSPESLAEIAVEGWMESPGHRENILRPKFSIEGIGVTFADNEAYVTQNFC